MLQEFRTVSYGIDGVLHNSQWGGYARMSPNQGLKLSQSKNSFTVSVLSRRERGITCLKHKERLPHVCYMQVGAKGAPPNFVQTPLRIDAWMVIEWRTKTKSLFSQLRIGYGIDLVLTGSVAAAESQRHASARVGADDGVLFFWEMMIVWVKVKDGTGIITFGQMANWFSSPKHNMWENSQHCGSSGPSKIWKIFNQGMRAKNAECRIEQFASGRIKIQKD